MSDTPTAQVIAERSTPEQVKDGLGRMLTLRKIGALQKLRLFKACGQNGTSPHYLGLAMLASAVSEIDGVPVLQPVNEQQVEALVAKLGDEGLEAVGTAMVPPNGEPSDDMVAAAKN